MSKAFEAMTRLKVEPVGSLSRDLASVLNKYGMSTETNIPDWVLASHLIRYMESLAITMQDRDQLQLGEV
jgi:hypothetical protein